MSTPVILLTSTALTPEEFIAFLPQAGAYPTAYGDEHSGGFQGQMDKDGDTIWMGIDNTVSDAIATDPELAAEREAVLAKLGTLPSTGIVVEPCGNTWGNTRLTMEFILAFAQRWPCVVQVAGDDVDFIYSAAEFARAGIRAEP